MDKPNGESWIESIDSYLTGSQKDIANNFLYKPPKRYHNFASTFIELDIPIQTGNTFRFVIPKYGDLISKMYLKFSLPPLTPHITSNWVCWTNAIGIFLIHQLDVLVNNQIIETITGDSMYNTFLNTTKTSKRDAMENMIGLYHTDSELRKNANTHSHYIIPLHLFFTTAYHNAFPLHGNNILEIQITLIPKQTRYISSNMITPHDYQEITLILDVEYVYVSEEEQNQMKSTDLTYVLETNHDVQIPVFQVNSMDDISYITHNIMEFFHSISDTLQPQYRGVYDNIVDYIEYVTLNHTQYGPFYNSLLSSIIISPNDNTLSEPNSDILDIIDLNSHYAITSSAHHFSSIKDYINSVVVTNFYDNNSIFMNSNGFEELLDNSINRSVQHYISYTIPQLSYQSYSYESYSIESFANCIHTQAENEIAFITQSISVLENENNNIRNRWCSYTNHEYSKSTPFGINNVNINIQIANSKLANLLEGYKVAKQEIEDVQTPPLTEYVQTYMNNIRHLLQNELTVYNKQKYFESSLNVFSFNNTLVVENSVITYPPGNYHPQSFPFYTETPIHNTFFIPYDEGFPPAGPPPDLEHTLDDSQKCFIYKTSLERILSNSTFVYNCVPHQYYIHNINAIIDPMLEEADIIVKDNTINLVDYSNAIDLINGLNTLVNNEIVKARHELVDNTSAIKANIHQNITDVLHDVVQMQQDEFIQKSIHPTRKHIIDTIDVTTRYLYTLVDHNSIYYGNNTSTESSSHFYNETVYTLLQYYNNSCNSNNILNDVVTYLPTIHLFEDIFDSLYSVAYQVSELTGIGGDSERIYSVLRNIMHSTKRDDISQFAMKFIINDTNINQQFEKINLTTRNIEYLLSQLWLKEFQILKERYSTEVAKKHLDRHIEHINGKKYKLPGYITVAKLDLISVYRQLVEFDFNSFKFDSFDMYNSESLITFGIFNTLHNKRQDIIYLDTLEYKIKNMSKSFLESVSYPIQIENMSVSNVVYNNLTSDIILQIQNYDNEYIYNSITYHTLTRNINSILIHESMINSFIHDMYVVDEIIFNYVDLTPFEKNIFDLRDTYINFFEVEYAKYENEYAEYEINQKQKEHNNQINNIRRQKFDYMLSHFSLDKKRYTLEVNFDYFKRLPIKCMWFSIHRYKRFHTKNRFSQRQFSNIYIDKIHIQVGISTTTITHDEIKFIKPYFYSKNMNHDDMYCLPFCLDVDSQFPSGAFNPLHNEISIRVDIITQSSNNIFIDMNTVQITPLEIKYSH